MEDKNRIEEQQQQIENNNKYCSINPNSSIITLNINDLSTSIKRQKLSQHIKETRLNNMFSTHTKKTPFLNEDTYSNSCFK